MTQYATIAQLQTRLEISGTLSATQTANMNLALTNASAIIDEQTHRHFEAATDSTRLHDALADVEKGRRLWLKGDLAVLTSITNGDGSSIALNAVMTEPSYELPFFAITLKGSSGKSWTYNNDPEGAIAVTGRWAYSVTAPDAIVQATLRLAEWFYRQPSNALDLDRAVIVGNTTIAPSAIPADVFVILRPYMRVVP
jgi:hypothetical protein